MRFRFSVGFYLPFMLPTTFTALYWFFNTESIIAMQNLSFLNTREFFLPFLQYGGGISDYIGLYLTCFLQHRLLGAIVLGLLLLSTLLLLLFILKRFGKGYNTILLATLPIVILGAMPLVPAHSIAINIKVMLSLALLALGFMARSKLLYLFLQPILPVAVWYICGFFPFFIALAIIVIFLLSARRFANAVLLPAASFLFVLLLSNFLVITPITNEIASYEGVQAYTVAILTLAIVLPLAILIGLFRFSIGVSYQIAACFIMAILVSYSLYNPLNQFNARILSAGYVGDHNRVLELRESIDFNTPMVSAYTNLALLSRDELPSRMFEFNQIYGKQGLVPVENADATNALVNMKVCFEVGLVNESIRWAMEASTGLGYSSVILTNLVLCNLINDNLRGAEKYARLLNRKVLSGREKKWINGIIENYKNGSIDPLIQGKRKGMPKRDFFLARNTLKASDFLWATTPEVENRRAVDMLAAFCMIEGNIQYIPNVLIKYRQLGKETLPKHLQECAYNVFMITNRMPGLHGYTIDEKVIKRGEQYFAIKRDVSLSDQQRFNTHRLRFEDTYWFYLDYVK